MQVDINQGASYDEQATNKMAINCDATFLRVCVLLLIGLELSAELSIVLCIKILSAVIMCWVCVAVPQIGGENSQLLTFG